MPRKPRIQLAGAIYNIGSRGNGRRTLFHDDLAYTRFLEILGAAVMRFEWLCHTYCLMPNHVHLLIETTDVNISAGTQWLKGRYAQWFNTRADQTGHVFEGRYYGELVESDSHLLGLVRYILNNPVRAGLCNDASGWKWSSYRALVGEVPMPAFLCAERVLGYFGDDREAFSEFVLAAPTTEHRAA